MKPLEIIEAAKFDEHDCDIATSGLCATFALAFYHVLSEKGYEPKLCVAYVDNLPEIKSDLFWKHALVKVDGLYYDVDGNVESDHVIANYCWGTVSNDKDIAELSFSDFSEMVEKTKNSYCADHYQKWFQMLQNKD